MPITNAYENSQLPKLGVILSKQTKEGFENNIVGPPPSPPEPIPGRPPSPPPFSNPAPNRFTCPTCGKVFSTKEELTMHIETTHQSPKKKL